MVTGPFRFSLAHCLPGEGFLIGDSADRQNGAARRRIPMGTLPPGCGFCRLGCSLV